jgi:predicted nucleic acid-binding protein
VNFLDTNVVVYAFTNDRKSGRAQETFAQESASSVQVLNEFVHVARRKLGIGWSEIHEKLALLHEVCRVIAPVDANLHREALWIAERYRFGIYDGLIVAAALATECDVLYSEDLHHGQVIEGRLRVINPFASD